MNRMWIGLVLVGGTALLGREDFAWAKEDQPRTDKHAALDPAILKELRIEPLVVKKEDSGFVVGGKNATKLIRSLPRLHGKTIERLEKVMRPGFNSSAGFLGPKESLLEVLAADNALVVDEWKLSHQELAPPMIAVAVLGFKNKDRLFSNPSHPFEYRGRKFTVKFKLFRGFVDSPFDDGTKTNAEAEVHNLSNGEKIWYSLLVPQMIERYGFYEGKGTKYRVPPERIVAVFDFLKKNGR